MYDCREWALQLTVKAPVNKHSLGQQDEVGQIIETSNADFLNTFLDCFSVDA